MANKDNQGNQGGSATKDKKRDQEMNMQEGDRSQMDESGEGESNNQ